VRKMQTLRKSVSHWAPVLLLFIPVGTTPISAFSQGPSMSSGQTVVMTLARPTSQLISTLYHFHAYQTMSEVLTISTLAKSR
jgi:hypothetical protein